MAIDMNVDIGEMVKGLFSKKDSEGSEGAKPKSPVSKIMVVIVLVLVIIGLYVFYYYLPAREDLRIKKTKISQIETMQFEISELSSSIDKAKIDLIAAEKNYEKLTKLFHTNKELEDLYKNISSLAVSNKLMVRKIEKGDERPIFEVDVIDSQSLEFDKTIKLLQIRGKAMQSAVPKGEGGMLAVLGAEIKTISVLTPSISTDSPALIQS